MIANRVYGSLFFATFATIISEKKGFFLRKTFFSSRSERRYFLAIIERRRLVENTWAKTFCCALKRYNTGSTTSSIVVFAFSANHFETVRIAHCKRVTTLSATRTQNLFPVYSRLSCQKTMHTKSFSFFKFTNHNNIERKITHELYKKSRNCQNFFRVFSENLYSKNYYLKSSRLIVVEYEMAGLSQRSVRRTPCENHISIENRTYG